MTDTASVIIKAANFAAIKHKDQRRSDPEQTPYINHPIGVANILTSAGVTDVAVLVGALLHDTVEDTDTSLEEVEAEFGPEVRGIVAEVSDDKNLEKMERKRLQIVRAPHKSPKAKLVKLADKLYNLRDLERATPSGWTQERKQAYFVWAAKVVLGLRGSNGIIEAQLDEILIRNGVTNPSQVILEESEKKE